MNDPVLKMVVYFQQVWGEWTNPPVRDEGSATETAIIVGLVSAAALVMAFLIVQAIEKYSGKIP